MPHGMKKSSTDDEIAARIQDSCGITVVVIASKLPRRNCEHSEPKVAEG